MDKSSAVATGLKQGMNDKTKVGGTSFRGIALYGTRRSGHWCAEPQKVRILFSAEPLSRNG